MRYNKASLLKKLSFLDFHQPLTAKQWGFNEFIFHEFFWFIK